MRPTLKITLVTALIVTLGVAAVRERWRRLELEARVGSQRRYLQRLHEQVGRVQRDSDLRRTFGDLGLVILEDPERIEVLRLGTTDAGGVPEVAGIQRVLGREFAERLGRVLLREADYSSFDDFPSPWSRGFRVWRRGEHLDIFYESHGWHLDVRALATNADGAVVSDIGSWSCVSHESLGKLIDAIEAVERESR